MATAFHSTVRKPSASDTDYMYLPCYKTEAFIKTNWHYSPYLLHLITETYPEYILTIQTDPEVPYKFVQTQRALRCRWEAHTTSMCLSSPSLAWWFKTHGLHWGLGSIMQKKLKMASFFPEIKNGTMLEVVMTSSFISTCKTTKKYLVTIFHFTISAQPEQWNALVPSLS